MFYFKIPCTFFLHISNDIPLYSNCSYTIMNNDDIYLRYVKETLCIYSSYSVRNKIYMSNEINLVTFG